MQHPQTVDEYIGARPLPIAQSLTQLRNIIRAVCPKADERISYGMPFYAYKGRLVYFAAQKNYIGLYIPPPIIAENPKILKLYTTTKSAVHLPFKIPIALVKKLVRKRMKYNETKWPKAKAVGKR